MSLAIAFGLTFAAAGCAEAEPPAAARPSAPPATAWVEIGDELFELELALDRPSRHLGLSHRRRIDPGGGMLFVFPDSRNLAFVMRHCPNPIDVAFLDESGRIVAIHAMTPEPPKRPDESSFAYERRLPGYPSGVPARFAIETAGGRLAEVGAAVGQRVVFDVEALLPRAR